MADALQNAFGRPFDYLLRSLCFLEGRQRCGSRFYCYCCTNSWSPACRAVRLLKLIFAAQSENDSLRLVIAAGLFIFIEKKPIVLQVNTSSTSFSRLIESSCFSCQWPVVVWRAFSFFSLAKTSRQPNINVCLNMPENIFWNNFP